MWLRPSCIHLMAFLVSMVYCKLLLVRLEESVPASLQAMQGNRGGSYRIIGGQEATPHQYPWQVLIVLTTTGGFCGGSILNSDTIMSAAHCVYSNYADNFKIAVGAHLFEDRSQFISVKNIIKHPWYNATGKSDYDISIFKLKTPLMWNGMVGPVCLPESSTSRCLPNTPAVITGWGKASPGQLVMPKLQVANVAITVNCGFWAPGIITERMICATAQGRSTCLGDSGGPLVQRVGNSYIQCGIISFTKDAACSDPTFASVLARVTALMPFIRENAGSFCLA